MLFPLLLVTICSCTHSEQNFSQIAQELVIKSELLATFGSNSLEKLQNVADNIEEYLKLSARVGAVVAAAASRMTFRKDTDEYHTLAILHNEWINFLEKKTPQVPNFGPSNAIHAYWKEYANVFFIGGDGGNRKSLPEDYITLKHDIYAIATVFDTSSLGALFWLLENPSINVDNIASSALIQSLIAQLRSWVKPFNIYYHGNDQRMQPLMVLVEQLTLDILQAEAMTALCMNTSFSDGRTDLLIAHHIEESAERVRQVANYTRLWVEQAQMLSWPRIGVAAAKRELGKREILATEFNATAATVQKIFQERSTDSVTYQVLVVPSSEMGDLWSARNQNPENYANFTTSDGLDVHLFRFMSSEQNRTDTPAKWLETNREAIIDVLRRGVSDSAEKVMNDLSADPATKPIFEYYRAVILFHGQSLLQSRAAIIYGLAPSQLGFELVEHSENGFFAHNWKLFMFL